MVFVRNVLRFLVGDTKNGDCLILGFGLQKFMLDFEYYSLVDLRYLGISVLMFGSMIC